MFVQISMEISSKCSPEFFKALSDGNRLRILSWLCSCSAPQSVSEVREGCKCQIDFSVVSRHLVQLRNAGILESAKDGREVRYRVNFEGLAQTFRELADMLESCNCCCNSNPENGKEEIDE